MSIEMMIYLIGVLGGIDFALSSVFIASLVVGAVVGIGCLVEGVDFEDSPNAARFLRAIVITATSTLALNIVIPSQKTATMMAAASLGKDALASEVGQKLKKVLDAKLDDLVAETAKKGK